MAENEYIRKAQVKRVFRRLLNDERSANEIFQAGFEHSIHIALEKIENISVADVAPVVHGHWIKKFPYGRECSNCGALLFHEFMPSWKAVNYCHSCGAKMDGKGGNE